ncbi:hypothetical protein JCM17961_09930 [Endothiovibrio diazotrophicus]
MPSQAHATTPVAGRAFKDRLGHIFTVLTVCWDRVVISYRHGGTQVIDLKEWDRRLPLPH